MLGWATIGAGGPQLAAGWAAAVLVPVLIGVARYLTIALRGAAARPEHLVQDRVLQLSGLAVAVLFVLGHAR